MPQAVAPSPAMHCPPEQHPVGQVVESQPWFCLVQTPSWQLSVLPHGWHFAPFTPHLLLVMSLTRHLPVALSQQPRQLPAPHFV